MNAKHTKNPEDLEFVARVPRGTDARNRFRPRMPVRLVEPIAAFSFEGDFAGERYAALVEFLAARASSVSLVVRDGRLPGRAKKLYEGFLAAGAKAERRGEWPGTRLAEGEATVLVAPLTPVVAKFLATGAPSLFAWCAPDRPEDLAFLDAAGTAVLETVAHERLGTLRLDRFDWDLWNADPHLGGDWRWRDASNNLRPE